MMRFPLLSFLLLFHLAIASELRFCSWNLNNFFLKQPVAPNGEPLARVKIKPEKEVKAVIETINKIKPDVIGLSELGHQDELIFLQQKLKEVGADYPYTSSTSGSDLFRSIAILSKYPITQTVKPRKLVFHSGKQNQTIRRGFLSTKIETPLGSIHFVGCHLKSKRPMNSDSEHNVRYGEALRLRDHLLDILNKNTKEKLIVYGDFNDTRNSAVIRLIGGKIGHHTRLTKLPLKSSNHTYWTHHWKSEDVYSRFDYIFLSESLKKRYLKASSYIASDTLWHLASDHRPLLLTLE